MANEMIDHVISEDREMNEQGIAAEIESRSTLVSRNITVLGRRTSVRLEPEMWNALREIARREGCKIHDICSLIQLRKNPQTSLTAAIRVFLMLYFRAAGTEEGHRRAGHGSFANMMHRARMTEDMLRTLRKSGGTALYGGGANDVTSVAVADAVNDASDGTGSNDADRSGNAAVGDDMPPPGVQVRSGRAAHF